MIELRNRGAISIAIVSSFLLLGCGSDETNNALTSSEVLETAAPASGTPGATEKDLAKIDRPQHDIRFAIFNGEPDCGAWTGAIYEAKYNASINYGVTCGPPGLVSCVTLNFLRNNGTSDVYELTREFPFGAGVAGSTMTRQVEYSGERIVVFENEHQTIVFDPFIEEGD